MTTYLHLFCVKTIQTWHVEKTNVTLKKSTRQTAKRSKQPTKQYTTITQPNPGSKKWAIEQTGNKCVLCDTVYAGQIRICTDHSTSISGFSPCFTINDKIREASVTLEDKKDPNVSLSTEILSSDAFRCYDRRRGFEWGFWYQLKYTVF